MGNELFHVKGQRNKWTDATEINIFQYLHQLNYWTYTFTELITLHAVLNRHFMSTPPSLPTKASLIFKCVTKENITLQDSVKPKISQQ